MDAEAFRKSAHQAVDWVANYLEKIEKYPVKSPVVPREIFDKLPHSAPRVSENFEQIIQDVNEIILPGITHWQHPNFHAYFPANNSHPSILGEIITAGLGAQCMIWETSPAASELEEKMMEWIKEMMVLPDTWSGVIQDSASTATLAALLSAREKATENTVNHKGFTHQTLRVYCSEETHSSIDKAVKIAGIGSINLVKIKTDATMALIVDELALQIAHDLKKGMTPCCVIATLGTTSTLAFDPLEKIAAVCQKNNVWLHVDAAYAGSAFILPEFRYLMKGLEHADSYVFNPHKWLMVNFDCSAYFVKSKENLINTFGIHPEYLKTEHEKHVNNYRDWGVPLGRRFRALKLWFVLRSYGKEGLQKIIRKHISYGVWIKEQIEMSADFELLAPQVMNMVVFRYYDPLLSLNDLNTTNAQMLKVINDSGSAYLSHTLVGDKYAIRLVLGQTNIEIGHVEKVWELISSMALKIKGKVNTSQS